MKNREVSDADALEHVIRGSFSEDEDVSDAEVAGLIASARIDRLERDHNAIMFEIGIHREGSEEGLVMAEMVWSDEREGWYRFYDGHCVEPDAEDAFVEEAEDGTYLIDWGE